jgi:hypothetical protein
MKYGSFLKMRFLSLGFSKTNTKYHFPTKWLFIPYEMSGLQFLCTQDSTDLGEGQSPVNFPIRPLSARLTVDLQVSSRGSSTLGMHSSFFTNIYCAANGGLLEASATSFMKASNSGKGDGVGTAPPPESMDREPLLMNIKIHINR